MWPRSDIDQLRRRSVLLRYTELLPSICLPVLLFPTQIPRCVTGPRCWWGNMRPGLSRFTRSCATDVEGRSPRHHKPQGRGGGGVNMNFHVCLSSISGSSLGPSAYVLDTQGSVQRGLIMHRENGRKQKRNFRRGSGNGRARQQDDEGGETTVSSHTEGGFLSRFPPLHQSDCYRWPRWGSLAKNKITTFNLIHRLSAAFS